MENAQRVVNDILSRNKKDRLLATLLYIIVIQFAAIVVLYNRNTRLYSEKQQVIEKEQQLIERAQLDKIDFLKAQNDYLMKLKNEVDSANTKLQLFNIQKQMR